MTGKPIDLYRRPPLLSRLSDPSHFRYLENGDIHKPLHITRCRYRTWCSCLRYPLQLLYDWGGRRVNFCSVVSPDGVSKQHCPQSQKFCLLAYCNLLPSRTVRGQLVPWLMQDMSTAYEKDTARLSCIHQWPFVQKLKKLHAVRWFSRPWRKITAIAKNHSTRPKSRWKPRCGWSWIRDYLTALRNVTISVHAYVFMFKVWTT